jgi:hypothetical protein
MGRAATTTRTAAALAALAALAGALTVSGAATAAPKQPRDYALDPPKRGLWATGDAFTLGVQGALELRLPIEDEGTGMVHLRASSLASLGFGEVAGHAEARLMFLTLGATGGYRDAWRTTRAAPGKELSRQARTDLEQGGQATAEVWPFAEGRARLTVPLESLFFVTMHTVRWEDSPAGAYDWFHANVHDGGVLYRADSTLYARSAKFGAFGPTLRFMDMPRDGGRVREVAVGANLVSRVGLFKRDDLLFASLLVRPGDPEFGYSVLRLPIWTIIAYRASFRVW